MEAIILCFDQYGLCPISVLVSYICVCHGVNHAPFVVNAFYNQEAGNFPRRVHPTGA